MSLALTWLPSVALDLFRVSNLAALSCRQSLETQVQDALS